MNSSGTNSEKQIRILHVDDDPSFLEIVKLILELNHNILVDSTHSCFDALSLLKSTGYDAVISDYRMIQMDGMTFLQKIREIDPEIPFIFFSGGCADEIPHYNPRDQSTVFLQKGGNPAIRYAELYQCICERVHVRRFNSSDSSLI